MDWELQKVYDQCSIASWSLTDTEPHYTQIKKEALATMWACEKFACSIQGKIISYSGNKLQDIIVPLLKWSLLEYCFFSGVWESNCGT